MKSFQAFEDAPDWIGFIISSGAQTLFILNIAGSYLLDI